mmetsp:Transcript_69214/g.80726  ORF Transcript_69214/g.80726 Transcript_69214/m.80726 type:complete len:202 (-) Transcript_69214:1370-1975(-)
MRRMNPMRRTSSRRKFSDTLTRTPRTILKSLKTFTSRLTSLMSLLVERGTPTMRKPQMLLLRRARRRSHPRPLRRLHQLLRLLLLQLHRQCRLRLPPRKLQLLLRPRRPRRLRRPLRRLPRMQEKHPSHHQRRRRSQLLPQRLSQQQPRERNQSRQRLLLQPSRRLQPLSQGKSPSLRLLLRQRHRQLQQRRPRCRIPLWR